MGIEALCPHGDKGCWDPHPTEALFLYGMWGTQGPPTCGATCSHLLGPPRPGQAGAGYDSFLQSLVPLAVSLPEAMQSLSSSL